MHSLCVRSVKNMIHDRCYVIPLTSIYFPTADTDARNVARRRGQTFCIPWIYQAHWHMTHSKLNWKIHCTITSLISKVVCLGLDGWRQQRQWSLRPRMTALLQRQHDSNLKKNPCWGNASELRRYISIFAVMSEIICFREGAEKA